MIASSNEDDDMESSLHVKDIIHHDIITLYSQSLLNTIERVRFYQDLLIYNHDDYFMREIRILQRILSNIEKILNNTA